MRLGKHLSVPRFGGWKPIVVGVVNDYHQVSLKKTLGSFHLLLYNIWRRILFIARSNNEYSTKRWNMYVNPGPQHFPEIHLNIFSWMIISIANTRMKENLENCLPVLPFWPSSLVAWVYLGSPHYMANQRIKEIGIRKVLGASVGNIATMLSKDFLRLVAIAILIASPIAWFVMDKWLQDFAHRIRYQLVGICICGIGTIHCVITVSFQAIKAAIANPVKSLRTE